MSEKVKLIVTLSKGQYENLKDIQFGSIVSRVIFDAVQNGIPLPKGHGDLIDRDELLKEPMDTANYPSNYVKLAQAIIIADKESRDANSN